MSTPTERYLESGQATDDAAMWLTDDATSDNLSERLGLLLVHHACRHKTLPALIDVAAETIDPATLPAPTMDLVVEAFLESEIGQRLVDDYARTENET